MGIHPPDGHVVLEEWIADAVEHTPAPSALQRKLLGSFDLATLPQNQEHEAVDGWNMLRLQLRKSSRIYDAASADGRSGGVIQASIWWNPTHADSAGATRGLRLNATISETNANSFGAARVGKIGLSAAVRGGASAKVDYIGVYQNTAPR